MKKAAGIEKGSGEPNKSKVGKISRAKVREIRWILYDAPTMVTIQLLYSAWPPSSSSFALSVLMSQGLWNSRGVDEGGIEDGEL